MALVLRRGGRIAGRRRGGEALLPVALAMRVDFFGPEAAAWSFARSGAMSAKLSSSTKKFLPDTLFHDFDTRKLLPPGGAPSENARPAGMTMEPKRRAPMVVAA